jgi:dihydroorotase
MNCLITNVTIVDASSNYHLKTIDIFIKQGQINMIGKNISQSIAAETRYENIDGKKLFLSAGWMDFYANFCDPGNEHKEDIKSGLQSAAAGGFTAVLLLPNTDPVIDNKSAIEYVKQMADGNVVDLFPTSSLTVKGEGKDMTELLDVYHAGAVAYTDANKSVNDAGTLMRGLQYIKPFNGIVINKPDDTSISKGGMMNEGVVSASLGLKPIPSIAEEVMVIRDIYLSEYTQSRLMIGPISTARSVDLIRDAKKKGISVSTFVLSTHLFFDDSYLSSFDSNYKIKPALRTKEDIKALKKGLKDGTIDIIASGHEPQNEELKKVEFDYASSGIINLQTSFSAANTALKDLLSVEELVEKFSINPRRAINKNVPVIKEGEEANLTLFSIESDYIFNTKNNKSKSINSPFFDKPLKGKPIAIINKNQLKYC